MFRIKTDIRQFNCETQEKVEKLIRNWVIRPTDLIYHTDDKSWEPIGDHPDFGVLFANLRDASDEEDVMTTTELDQISESISSSEDSEPALPPIEDSPLAGMSEIVAEDPESNAPPSGPMRAAILSGHGKIRKLAGKDGEEEGEDEDELELTVDSGPLPIPQAPEGVEGVASNPDEVTMMTERTAEFLGLQDPEEEEQEAEEAAAEAEVSAAADEEEDAPKPLPIPEAPQGVEGVAPSDEPTHIFERDDEEEEEEGEEAEEEEYVLEEIEPSEASHASVAEEDSEPRLGRHDLPEELFLTNELDRPEEILSIHKKPLLDELPEEAAPEDEDAWANEVTQQIESPLQGASDSEPDEEEDVDDLWGAALSEVEFPDSEAIEDEDDEEIRETIELDSPISRDNIPVADELEDDAPKGESDRIFVDDDYSREADNLGSVDTEAFSAELAASDEVSDIDLSVSDIDAPDFDLDGELELSSTPTEPPPEGDATGLDDDASSPEVEVLADDDKDIAFEETDEFSTEALEEILDDKPSQDRDFVSEGYRIPFPFKIQPSQADLNAGLVLSKASDEEKDLAFPRPLPKKLGEITSRRYGYGDPPTRVPGDSPSPTIMSAQRPHATEEPPSDYSKLFLAFIMLVFVLIVITFVFMSS
ncbi:MAG: hypothetical protein VYE40_13195 [Myxococcota bacterium]|nr:hypothetical protein [Myxococcota bacterium]